jgi:hypothetical protein
MAESDIVVSISIFVGIKSIGFSIFFFYSTLVVRDYLYIEFALEIWFRRLLWKLRVLKFIINLELNYLYHM